ncbi:hypothetical protein LX36DRAFT_174789 [Colletotrichum falcatum]|nr:hypothetical protein LX36DRAFT_174789 [Colletotrichum falcatum]
MPAVHHHRTLFLVTALVAGVPHGLDALGCLGEVEGSKTNPTSVQTKRVREGRRGEGVGARWIGLVMMRATVILMSVCLPGSGMRNRSASIERADGRPQDGTDHDGGVVPVDVTCVTIDEACRCCMRKEGERSLDRAGSIRPWVGGRGRVT